jgi:hypothetical protein
MSLFRPASCWPSPPSALRSLPLPPFSRTSRRRPSRCRAPTRRRSSPSGRRSTSSATCGAPFGRSSPPSGRRFGDDWIVRWDRRSDRPHLLQGSGVAIIPGSGNGLLPGDVGLAPDAHVSLEVVAQRLQDFVAAYPELLGVEGFDLRLDRSRSTAFGVGDTHWFVEFAQFESGVPVEGANVFFRLNHGNLVQFGADRVAPVDLDTQPALERGAAFAAALARAAVPGELPAGGGPRRRKPAHLSGRSLPDESPGERFAGVAGTGYGHKLVWKFVFRLPGEATTYQVLFDAHRNLVLEVTSISTPTSTQRSPAGSTRRPTPIPRSWSTFRSRRSPTA